MSESFTTHVVHFSSDSLTLCGVMYLPVGAKSLPAVLFLHGGGPAGKTVNVYSQELLAKSGYASLAFDFRGVGESEGKFEDGSLTNRLRDAFAAYTYLTNLAEVDADRICVSGSSMGAHTAARLTERVPTIKALNLVCAAAYGPQAEDKKLNEDFSSVIRQENSWSGSLAFENLKSFSGAVSVVYGEFDDVIPKAVQTEYSQFVTAPEYFVVLKNGKHQLNRPKNELEEHARDEMENFRLSFLEKEL